MRSKGLAIGLIGAVLGAGTTMTLFTSPAASQSAPVTPKMESPPEAKTLSRSFASVAKALRPSVVRLDVETGQAKPANGQARRHGQGQAPPDLHDFFEKFFGEDGESPFPQLGPGRGTGSGVIIDGSGDILTNGHVVANASKVTVTLFDGKQLEAKVVGRDEETDVAIVRLEKVPAGLVAARMGDPDRSEVGDWVLAIGSPLGMAQTVTAGIISGKGKTGGAMAMSGRRVREYLQTDAKINPGNSGGPLVNLEGEVIGINTLINVGAGGAYGFAIPINQARHVANELIKNGRVRYAFLGVTVGDLQAAKEDSKRNIPKSAPDRAALVATVLPGSPAAKAGMRTGDIITKIDNQKIEGASDVVAYVSTKTIGSRVSLAVLRDGKASNVQVTLAELDRNAEQSAGDVSDVGLSLQTLTPDVARFLRLDPTIQGAVITEVAPNSRAAKAGLTAEDVIVEVNKKPVNSAEEAAAAMKEAGHSSMMLKVRAGPRLRMVVIPASDSSK